MNVLSDVDFYVSKAKETAVKLNKDIRGELEMLKPAYGKGTSEMLKEAERYASEGQIYGMHVYIENAINYAKGVYEIQELNGRKISVAVNAGNCVGDGSCHMVCKPNAMVCVPRKIEN